MRFRVLPFRHPDYSALRERSKSLALLWGMGHVVFVLALAVAFGAPLAVAMVAMIDSEMGGKRAWSTVESSVGVALLFATIGVVIKWYATKKG